MYDQYNKEIPLLLELTVSLAAVLESHSRGATFYDGDPPPPSIEFVEGEVTTVTEYALEILCRLNLIEGAFFNHDRSGFEIHRSGVNNENWYINKLGWPKYVRIFEELKIRDVLGEGFPRYESVYPGSLKDHLIGGWLTNTDTMGQDLHSPIKPWTPHPLMMNGVLALYEYGYALKRGTQYIWADKISPHMRQKKLWNEQNQLIQGV